MPEPINPGTPTPVPSPASGTPAPVQSPVPPTGVKSDPEPIPYPRFKEVNDKLKALEDEKAAREETERKAREDKLIKEGEYKTILEQKEAEIERLKKVESEHKSTQKVIRDGALAKLNDEKLKEIAAELSTPKLLEFIDTYQSKVSPPGSPKGAPVDTKGNTLAPLIGESPQAYAERMRTSYRKGDK